MDSIIRMFAASHSCSGLLFPSYDHSPVCCGNKLQAMPVRDLVLQIDFELIGQQFYGGERQFT
jgi:hypothetical protein